LFDGQFRIDGVGFRPGRFTFRGVEDKWEPNGQERGEPRQKCECHSQIIVPCGLGESLSQREPMAIRNPEQECGCLGKTEGGLEKRLANLWSRNRIIQRPAQALGANSNGNCRIKLKTPSSILRLVAIGVLLAGITALFAYAGGWLTPHVLTPAQIADGFEMVNGPHPGFRRNHAKGVCVSGYFDSNGRGAALSKASIFQPGRVPVIGRFSLAGGQPNAADAPQTVRGLAVRFQLPAGEEWRSAMIDLPVFPVRTPQAFYDQLLASAPDPATGKPDPERMKAFFAKYPESAKAIQLIRSHPMSSGFENCEFYGLNAFRFTDGSGAVSWVRWSMKPAQPFEPVSAADAAHGDKNYLFDALITNIHSHPLEWHLIITVAATEDPTDDATLPWPPDRQHIDAGTLTIDHVESDDVSPARNINFDPLILPNGIAPSDDPLLSARSAVYSQSFTRREGEQKTPSAISPHETAE
jgi:catalase